MIRYMFRRHFILLVIGMPLCSLAQMPGLNGSSPAGTSMGTAILGKSSFSARVVTTVMTTVNGVLHEDQGTEYKIAISEGKIRVETDMEVMVNRLADSMIRNSQQIEDANRRKGKDKEEIPSAADSDIRLPQRPRFYTCFFSRPAIILQLIWLSKVTA